MAVQIWSGSRYWFTCTLIVSTDIIFMVLYLSYVKPLIYEDTAYGNLLHAKSHAFIIPVEMTGPSLFSKSSTPFHRMTSSNLYVHAPSSSNLQSLPTYRWCRQCTLPGTQCSNSPAGLQDSCTPVLAKMLQRSYMSNHLSKIVCDSLKKGGQFPDWRPQLQLTSLAKILTQICPGKSYTLDTCSLVGSTMLWSIAVITASQIVQVTKLPEEIGPLSFLKGVAS